MRYFNWESFAITKTFGKPASAGPPPPDVTTLSATVAHELNNIGASLFGFMELAAEYKSAIAIAATLVSELRIGVLRIAGLASLLEALAETQGEQAPVAVAACVSLPPSAAALDTAAIRWQCDRSIRVLVDAGHTQRSMHILRQLAPLSGGQEAQVVVELRQMPAAARCGACGAPFPKQGVGISIAESLSAAPGDFRRLEPGGMSIKRLALAAFAHIAHLAGGHLLYASATLPLTLFLPLADAESAAETLPLS